MECELFITTLQTAITQNESAALITLRMQSCTQILLENH